MEGGALARTLFADEPTKPDYRYCASLDLRITLVIIFSMTLTKIFPLVELATNCLSFPSVEILCIKHEFVFLSRF